MEVGLFILVLRMKIGFDSMLLGRGKIPFNSHLTKCRLEVWDLGYN